jgi:formylglycine-generating enzyme required for sulfatase activity
VHEVIISRGYWLFDTPCCQELWEAVLGADANKSGFRGGRRPVETVDWHDAVRFSKELNKLKKGLNLRLPREAEWEYACRAGTAGSRYGKLEDVAWYDGNSGKVTHDVGQLVANAWGLHDMLGNVWEWCLDGQRDYTEASLTDPDGGSGARRVIRGGGWLDDARGVRAASRDANHAGYRFFDLGFRCLSSEMEEEGAEQVEQGRSGAKQSEGGAEQASPASARKPGLFGEITKRLRKAISRKPKKKK